MNSRVVFIGWALLTFGLVAGVVWTIEVRAINPVEARVRAISVSDPKIFVALVTWCVYSFQLLARRTIGWRGRRAAYLSAVGFIIVLLNFLPVSYFLTDSHNFDTADVPPLQHPEQRPPPPPPQQQQQQQGGGLEPGVLRVAR